jgi:hypothetical protein
VQQPSLGRNDDLSTRGSDRVFLCVLFKDVVKFQDFISLVVMNGCVLGVGGMILTRKKNEVF